MSTEEFDLVTEEKAVQEADNWFDQKIFSDIREEIYQRGSFTVAVIHARADNKLYEGIGFSKARQEISIAQYDPDRGKQVARGRAIHDLFWEYKRSRKK